MMRKISIILLIIIKLITTNACRSSSKKVGDMHMHMKHGVLTSYEYVGNNDTSEIKFPGCEAEKIWIFARHGARHPFESTMKDIFTRLPKIRAHIKNAQLDEVKHWVPLFKYRNHGKMMTRGNNELLELGRRTRMRFPSLITENCDENMFKYKSTDTQRTKESAKQFGIGLLGEENYRKCWHHEPRDKTLVLEFYNYCNKWIRDVRDNIELRREETKFTASEHVTEMLRKVSDRIGYKVNFHDVSLIRQVCAYESAFHEDEKRSPWCTLLSPEEFEILEYKNDLYSYWVHGYGVPLTYQQACPMLADMFNFFDSDNGVKVMAYFGHDTGMWKIVALLGIVKDKHPLRSVSYIQSKDRKWKSSFISPFAANIAFVSYKCGESRKPSILFLHQERIVQLPGCPANKPCPIDIMKELYPANDEKCKFEKLCAV